MKIGLFLFKISVLFLIVVLLASSTTAQTDFDIRITRVDNYTALVNDNDTTFIFNATLEVINQASDNITITHADSCGFKLDVEYHDSNNWESVYPYGCFAVITSEDFAPGTTKLTVVGGIKFDQILNMPPDGDYTLKLMTYGQIDPSQVDNLKFSISSGVILGQAPVEERINYHIYPVSTVLVISLIINKLRKT